MGHPVLTVQPLALVVIFKHFNCGTRVKNTQLGQWFPSQYNMEQVEGAILCWGLLQPRFEERRPPRFGIALKESPRREGQRLQKMMTMVCLPKSQIA